MAVAIGDPEVEPIRDLSELPPHRLEMLRRFFLDYKTLEHKAVEVDDFEGAEAAAHVIESALAAYKQRYPKQGK